MTDPKVESQDGTLDAVAAGVRDAFIQIMNTAVDYSIFGQPTPREDIIRAIGDGVERAVRDRGSLIDEAVQRAVSRHLVEHGLGPAGQGRAPADDDRHVWGDALEDRRPRNAYTEDARDEARWDAEIQRGEERLSILVEHMAAAGGVMQVIGRAPSVAQTLRRLPAEHRNAVIAQGIARGLFEPFEDPGDPHSPQYLRLVEQG